MQAYANRSWKSRVACGLAAVVASTALLGGMLSLFAMDGGNAHIAQTRATSEPASAVTATLARKAAGV